MSEGGRREGEGEGESWEGWVWKDGVRGGERE